MGGRWDEAGSPAEQTSTSFMQALVLHPIRRVRGPRAATPIKQVRGMTLREIVIC